LETHAEQLKKAFDKFDELSDVVTEDLTETISHLNKKDCQYLRRAFFRQFFVWVEFQVHHIKQMVLIFHNTTLPVLSPEALAVLREEQPQLDQNGVLTTRPKFLPLSRNLRFAFKVFANTFQSSYELDVSGTGWQAFRRAVDIRNRLTHPKVDATLTITDEEIVDADVAYEWMKKTVIDLFDSIDRDKVLGIPYTP